MSPLASGGRGFIRIRLLVGFSARRLSKAFKRLVGASGHGCAGQCSRLLCFIFLQNVSRSGDEAKADPLAAGDAHPDAHSFRLFWQLIAMQGADFIHMKSPLNPKLVFCSFFL